MYWDLDGFSAGIFYGIIGGWFFAWLPCDMTWIVFSFQGNHLQTALFQWLNQASQLLYFSPKYEYHIIYIYIYIYNNHIPVLSSWKALEAFSQTYQQNESCLDRPASNEVVANQRLEVRPDFLGHRAARRGDATGNGGTGGLGWLVQPIHIPKHPMNLYPNIRWVWWTDYRLVVWNIFYFPIYWE